LGVSRVRYQAAIPTFRVAAEVGLVGTDPRAIAEPLGEFDHGPRALAMILEVAIAAALGLGHPKVIGDGLGEPRPGS
jgi:hypothetical protein